MTWNKLSIVLLCLLVLCALGLVTSQDRARKSFNQLERAQAQAHELEMQARQYEVEQTALTKSAQIDTRARSRLSMQPVSSDRTLHLNVRGMPRTAMEQR